MLNRYIIVALGTLLGTSTTFAGLDYLRQCTGKNFIYTVIAQDMQDQSKYYFEESLFGKVHTSDLEHLISNDYSGQSSPTRHSSDMREVLLLDYKNVHVLSKRGGEEIFTADVVVRRKNGKVIHAWQIPRGSASHLAVRNVLCRVIGKL